LLLLILLFGGDIVIQLEDRLQPNIMMRNWVSALYGPYSGMNFAMKYRFCLNLLLYREVRQNLVSDYLTA